MKKYEVLGNFSIIFPLEKGGKVYEEINMLNDVIRIALENGHIEVDKINVQIVREKK